MLVDADPAQGNSTFALGVDHEEAEFELLELPDEGFDLLPGAIDIAALTAYPVEQIPTDEYDWIIMDTAPGLGDLTLSIIALADIALVPVEADVYSVRQGARQALEVLNAANPEAKACLVVTKIDRRYWTTDPLVQEVTRMPECLKTRIRTCSKLREAPAETMSVLAHAPRSNGAKDYMALAKEVLRLA